MQVVDACLLLLCVGRGHREPGSGTRLVLMQGIQQIGAFAVTALLLVASTRAQTATNYTDVDILNFALNLEVQNNICWSV